MARQAGDVMSLDAIRKRLSAGENVSTEFVSDVNSAAEIGKAVCAFLNTDGGQVYCGVDDAGHILGIKPNVEVRAQRLERELKDLISPTTLFSAEVATVDGQPIIVVEVPAGLDRPYVFEGAVYLRKGAQTVTADAAELRALVREQADAPVRWERRISSISVDDLDKDEIRTTVRKIEEKGRFTLSDRDDDLAVLSDFSVFTNGGFTNAGDVLFSQRPTLRHPQCRVQLIQFAGEKSEDVYKDNRPFEGPLVRVYSELISAIRSAIPVQSVFLPGENRRVDQPAYDIAAISEGLVNAFVHRDYSAHSGGIRVQMFDNRIEIWNSGRLPEGLSPGDLRRDHASILVNPDIANVFAALDLMERIGRGTEKIVSASKGLGARPPLWRDEPSGVTLTIFRALQTDFGEAFEPNERQNWLLLDLQPGDSITPKEYQTRYAAGVGERQARRDLEELEALKWLVREGATKSTRYRLP
jgi:ATP-dependent DNA helicase RecG